MGRIRHSQGLLRAFLLLASFIILALAMAPMPVAAIMGTDFGFESGLTGWSTYGNVSTGSGGDYLAGSNTWTVGPYETKMAVVGPSGNSGVFTTVADALGLSAWSQSYLTTTFPNITNMAYIYADIPLAAGESFTMAWNYVATDYAPYNDASFCSLVNLNDAGDVPLVNGFNAEVSILGTTVTGTGNYSTGDYGSTGWQTAAFQASGAGTYRLGFTVFNLTDTQYNPYLFVDKDPGTTLKNGVPFNPVPPDDDPPPPPVTVAPSVTTGTASAITAVSAFVSGHVTSDGGEPVTERGIVFGLAPNPTTAGSKAAGGSGTGLFSAQLTGLAPGATYYARAYAINVKGTSYGDTISFTTVPPAPTVAAATAVTASSFTANWTAVAGATGYRLDVATDSSFLHVVSGYANLDAGSATSRTVSGLAAATPYYIRVRATNSAGTSPNSNTVTATTAKADQSISFPPLASRTYGDADFNPGATATSGLTVTYTSSNPQVATIVDNQVHIVGQGTATITAAQAGNGSWNPAPDQAQTLTVLRKTVTLAGTLAASNKTYDGTTAAIVTADGLSLVGLVGDDQVTVNPVGTFSDKNAAPGKTVSLTAATSLSGTDSENYTLSLAGAPAGQAAILQRLLTLSAFHADDKIYDGTVAAFGTGFEDDRISGDDLTFSYAAAFSDADIGVAKPVTFSDIAISGGLDAMNYTLADASGSTQATIERKNLHITLVDKSKTYGQIDPLFEATYSGFVSGEGPETLGSVVLYRVGGENAGTYTISYMIWDELAHNYTLIEHEGTFTIDTRPLTLVNRQAEDKVYDGTRAASASATLSGVLPGDNVGLQLSDILFDTKHAGTGKSVSATQILTGAQADNYSLTPAVPFATAAIGSRPLELSQFSADDKVYDGTTDATYTYQADQLPGDDLVFDLTAAFSDSQAGEDKLVTLTVDSLGGMDAANYTLMTPELTDTASISPVTLTVTGALALDKTYDGTRAAEVSGAVLHGVLAGDSVILDQATSGLFEQKAVGSNLNVTTNMTLTGEDSGNYVLAQPVLNKATIFQRVVFVVGAVAQDKAYDGTSIATITGAQPIGLIPGDDVALINRDIGLFPQLSPGSGLPVLPLMSLSGSDAPNYALMPPMLNNASILPRTLEVRAEDKEKTYGQIDPPLTVSYTGFAPGEDVSDLSGSLIVWRQTGENAGSYEIRLGSTLSSLNYAIEIQYGSLTIQPRTLTVSGAAASDKVYDGTPAASVSGAILQGVLEQDIGQVSLVQDTTGQFNQTNAGNGIAVVTSMALTGTKSGNYSLEQPGLFADILPCPITVTADARNKTYGDADPELTWQVTAGSLIGTDAPTGTPSRETGEDVGEYAISQGSLDFGDNYTVTFVSNNLTITARPITVKADVKSKTYGDADPELTWQVTAGSLVGTDAPTGTLNRAVGEDVGDYAIEPGSLDFGDNYTVTYVSDNLTITARAITITADSQSKTYGDADPELTWQVTAGSLVGTDAPTGTLSRAAGEDIGGYAILPGSLDFGDNYTVAYVSDNLTITARAITVTVDAKNKTYGDADPELTWQVTAGSLVGTDAPTGTLSRAAGENVGGYAILPGSLDFGDNYTVTYVSDNLTITARAITVTVDAKNKTYGDTDPELTWQVTAGSLIGTDAPTGTPSRETDEDVGEYAISQGSLDFGDNYTVTFVSNNLTISARPITVTIDAKNKTYGDTDPELTWQVTAGSLVGTDAPTGTLNRAVGEDVGDYAIEQGSLDFGDNYSVTFIGNDLTISARPITVTADSQSKTYGDADPELTWQLTAGSLVGLDAPTGMLSRMTGEDVGAYAILPGSLAFGDNYSVTFVGRDLTISARPITVMADSQSKTYGDTDPELTWQVTAGNPIGTDAPTGTLSRADGEDIGGYAIEQGSLDFGDNYSVTYIGSDLTITARSITVTADLKSKTYGDTDPELTWQVTAGSLIGLDTPIGSLNREAGEVVGDYDIEQGSLDFGDNYSVTFIGSDLTISARPITVTADIKSKTYGDADPELTWQVTTGSLVGLDTPIGSLNREAGEDVGDYAIEQDSLDFGDNYSVTFIGSDLTISARPITVTADSRSKTYGDADPELTWQVTAGSLIGTDAPTGTLNRAAGEDVGEYAISQGSLAFGDNYAVSFASNNLTITARAITVTADVKTKVYGDADPELTWQVTDGSLVGTDAPLGSLSREAGEDVGVYTIEQGSLAFGGNYCVSFVGSDLAIASRSLTIQAVSCSKTYGDADPAWQVMYENLASWDSEAVVQGLGLARAPGEAVGSYVISPSGATADNYTVIMLSGTLTIDKRPLTITAAAQTKGYGTADPAFSYALTAGSLIGDDSLTGELSRESGENVGSYDILQNSLTAGGNYQITFVGAELTITPYAEPLLHGSVANGHDPDNSGQISFVAESDDGYAFAYWSDGHTVFSTNPILTNPVGGIAGYHPVIWPIGPSTDLQAIGMSAQNESAVLFLNGVVRMVLPAHVDPEAVIAVTACDAVAGQDLLPSGMAAAQPFFCFLRSENLVGERIRIEIDLAQAGIQLGDEERESLTLYRWNEEEQIWKTAEIARQGVDWETGILWAEVEQFSTYGLFYTPQLVQTGETPVNGAWLLLLVGGCLMALILARKRLPGLGGRSDADA